MGRLLTTLNTLLPSWSAGVVARWNVQQGADATILYDSSGNAYNGALGASTAAPAWSGAGLTFDGGDYVNLYSAGLDTAFDETLGSVLVAGRVSGAGVWSDGAERNLIRFRATASNSVQIRKTATNLLQLSYIAGGTTNAISPAAAFTGTNAFIALLTWNKARDRVRGYLNGTLIGAASGLGVWAGALSSTQVTLGAANTSAGAPWTGLIGDAKLWNRELSPEQAAAVTADVRTELTARGIPF